MMQFERELCQCGKHYKVHHMVWHGWKVNWQDIKNKLSPESRRMLREEHLCSECRDNIKNEIIRLLSKAAA